MSDELRALLDDEPVATWADASKGDAIPGDRYRNAFRAEIRPYVEALEKDNEALRRKIRTQHISICRQNFDIEVAEQEAAHERSERWAHFSYFNECASCKQAIRAFGREYAASLEASRE